MLLIKRLIKEIGAFLYYAMPFVGLAVCALGVHAIFSDGNLLLLIYGPFVIIARDVFKGFV